MDYTGILLLQLLFCTVAVCTVTETSIYNYVYDVLVNQSITESSH